MFVFIAIVPAKLKSSQQFGIFSDVKLMWSVEIQRIRQCDVFSNRCMHPCLWMHMI